MCLSQSVTVSAPSSHPRSRRSLIRYDTIRPTPRHSLCLCPFARLVPRTTGTAHPNKFGFRDVMRRPKNRMPPGRALRVCRVKVADGGRGPVSIQRRPSCRVGTCSLLMSAISQAERRYVCCGVRCTVLSNGSPHGLDKRKRKRIWSSRDPWHEL
jgi:hypothetical protein